MGRREKRSTENRAQRPAAPSSPLEPVRPPAPWQRVLLAAAILAEVVWLVLLAVAKRI